MPANFIEFVNALIYGDCGAAELSLPAAVNHMTWTLDRLASPPASPGDDYLNHHLDVMLARYEAWRAKYNLPPVVPWDGTDIFFEPMMPAVGATVPPALSGGAFPAGWTTNDLGNAVKDYYDGTTSPATVGLRNFSFPGMGGTELTDEIKAPFSYRHWAFMKWASDLRKRLLGQPVFPAAVIYDRDGTILSEREFLNYFHQVHHVWHPNSGEPSWTEPTPGFRTAVGQYRRKKQLSRSQVGEEFFAFHRDHLVIFDRWMARTGQVPVGSLNTCGHEVNAPPPSTPPAGLDVWGGGMGLPLVDYVTRTINFSPAHESNWLGTLSGFDGTLREFANAGEMGQFFATDNNPFPLISVPGAPISDRGYHAPGHTLNGDLNWPVANNYSGRFFAWHGFIDDIWTKRQPVFTKLAPVQSDGSAFPEPRVMTILRDLVTGTDSVEPSAAVGGIDLTSGNGTLRVALNVRADTFGRPLNLSLRCEILREASGASPVITLTRELTAVPGAPAAPTERAQGTEFVEDFVFDGSAGTVDGGGKGPFASDNLSMSPTPVGFLNSLVRVTAVLTCDLKPDGTLPASAGTVSSSGTNVTGSGTAFNTLFREGDRVRAGGQTRTVITVASATALTVDAAFSPNLAAGTAYQRLDGFDAVESFEIPLVQEKLAPDITAYLDRSSFSKDQVDAIASGGQSVFENAFYVVLQDRTERPAPIVWPSDPKTDLLLPQFYGLIAPPLRAAGLYTDLAHAPAVELRDAATDAAVAGLTVEVTAADPEDPTLHPSVTQRVTYRCRVVFTGNAMFAGMAAGDTRDLKLRITATDRSGNQTTDDASRVRLQVNANPYMLDGAVPWLSVDTRVLQVREGDTRFGVTLGANPNTFIKSVIDALRSGSGAAGGESFDALPEDEAQSALEYSTQLGGVNVHNFALAKVRLQSVSGAPNVRASFRLFRWGVANVSFDDTLAYRTDAASGVALLGRTSTNELASVPFFAEPRVAVSASMTTQADPKNLFSFPPTGGGEALSFYGAYLDINQSAARFPVTYVGDGGFGGVPAADMRSIRDLMIGQHQCMVVELFDPGDPTVAGSTPGTSDNLSQRNLLILQTANPGSPSTRAVQHSFNIDLTRRRTAKLSPRAELDRMLENQGVGIHGHDGVAPAPDDGHDAHDDGHDHMEDDMHDSHADGHHHELHEEWEECFCPAPRLARPRQTVSAEHASAHSHMTLFFSGTDPRLIAAFEERSRMEAEEAERWQFDPDEWKRTDGLDELVFFWNNLPEGSEVELFLPGVSAEEIINYRNLRHAPGTVKIVDSHTLRLVVAGPSYVPVPPFWGDDLAGLVTVTLPPGIKEGQKFLVDVLQMRSETGRVLGGFQLNIQVGKAKRLIEKETRLLELFNRRLQLTPKTNRWRPVLERQVEFTRGRVRGFVELAEGTEGFDAGWEDPTERQHGRRVRVVLERIQILDDKDPLIKCAGEFRFKARVHTRNNGGLLSRTHFPEEGYYEISDRPGENVLDLDLTVFEGYAEDHLAVEVTGVELDTFDPDDRLSPYRRIFKGSPGDWLGSYGPADEEIDPEVMPEWRLWYRIESA